VRYIEVYNHKFLCFVRVFHPPSYFALFWSAILGGGAPLGNLKMENPPPSFLEEGAPFKNHSKPRGSNPGPWFPGAPLNLFLNDSLIHTPSRPLLLM
jgi:hypothetical protein